MLLVRDVWFTVAPWPGLCREVPAAQGPLGRGRPGAPLRVSLPGRAQQAESFASSEQRHFAFTVSCPVSDAMDRATVSFATEETELPWGTPPVVNGSEPVRA